MKNVFLFAALAFSLFSFVILGTTWTSDAAHSRLGFTVSHLGISEIYGAFGKFEATCTAEKADFTDAVIELSADIASINTGIEARDQHLQKSDMFDAEKYPTLNFKSTSVKKGKGKDLTVVGDLTLHGVTKSVTLTATYNGTVQHPMSKADVAGFKVKGKIKRLDFGIGAELPTMMVGDEINLIADLEMSKK